MGKLLELPLQIDLDSIQKIEVINKNMKKHTSTSKCWCKPKKVYKDKKNGNEVWVHYKRK